MTQIDLKYFFVERFRELLNRNSIDSYRVRCNNVFTLMKELRSVIDNWLRGYVKQFETVCLCIEETLDAIKNDEILDYSFYDKQLLIEDLTALSKANEKSRGELGEQSIYLLDKCITANQDSYLDKLYIAIDKILSSELEVADGQFKPLADSLNSLAGALACELLNERFSLRHLYRESVKLCDNVADFKNTFGHFRTQHSHNVPFNAYEVVLKMNGGRNSKLTTLDGFVGALPDGFVPEQNRNDKINKFLNDRGALFYQVQVDAHDSAMAITQAVERMESVIDRAMLGYSLLDVQIQKTALVILKRIGGNMYMAQPINVTDASYADDEEVVNKMITRINQILVNDHITDDVKDRLTSSLRHLRIGNTDSDTGQQLVNYWVALEFIFSSPRAVDSTIPRLEKNLTNVLMCCYATRRVLHLNQSLHKSGLLDSDKDWWRLEDAELDGIINTHADQLLCYHLQEMKAALRGNTDAAKQFFASHKKHLHWQIYRIYRYRNQLIHEAAILPGLENVIRCQRFYLVLLLNQMIGYFSETDMRLLSMDSFFFEYNQKYSLLNSTIKQEHLGGDRVEKLARIVVYSELIRQNL